MIHPNSHIYNMIGLKLLWLGYSGMVFSSVKPHNSFSSYGTQFSEFYPRRYKCQAFSLCLPGSNSRLTSQNIRWTLEFFCPRFSIGRHAHSKRLHQRSFCYRRLDFSQSCLNYCPNSKGKNILLLLLQKASALKTKVERVSRTFARKKAAAESEGINIKEIVII